MKKKDIEIRKAKEGGFIGISKEVPGAFTQGETKKEVVDNMKDAIKQLKNSLGPLKTKTHNYEKR